MTDIIQRAFDVGEVSEEYWLRNDLEWFNRSVRSCKNFIPTPGGVLINRGGTKYIGTLDFKPSLFTTLSKFNSVHYRLLAGKVGSNTRCSVVVNTTLTYTANLASPVNTNAIRDFVQYSTTSKPYNGGYITFSGDGTNLGGQYFNDLYYTGTFSSTLAEHTVGQLILNPVGLVSITGAAGTIPVTYYISAVTNLGVESPAIGPLTGNIALVTTSAPATVNFTEPASYAGFNITKYYIYRRVSGALRFVGDIPATAAGSAKAFVDYAFEPNVNLAPVYLVSEADIGQSIAINTCCNHKQRFIGAKRNVVFASRTGTPNSLVYQTPLQATDAFYVKSADMNAIKWVRSVGNKLFIFDTNAIWTMSGDANGAFSPITSGADKSWTQNVKDVMPLVFKNNITFASGNNEVFFLLQNQNGSDDYISKKVSEYSPKYLYTENISNLSYSYDLTENIWVLAQDANVSRQWRSVTLNERQNQMAWAHHEMSVGKPILGHEGMFVVERNLPGVGLVYTLETLEPHVDSLIDGVFLDGYVSYTSPATTTFILDHLTNLNVYAVADGIKSGPYLVNGAGVIYIAAGLTATKIHIGLPYESTVTTHDMDLVGNQTLVRQPKVTAAANVYFRNTANGEVRVNSDSWQQIKMREDSDGYASSVLKSGLTEDIVMSTSARREQTLSVRQSEPFPMTIVAIARSVKGG